MAHFLLNRENHSESEHPIVEVVSLSKSFKNIRAVDRLDFVIHPGEFVALLGPNGAGKTTLMEMIEGIQEPDEGQIRLFGMEWKSREREIRKRIGLALQETRFLEKVTVDEILNLFGSFYGRTRLSNDEILEQVLLTEKKGAFVNTLSGGQRQKLALGISLINRPELLLLDEPTTGLDPGARREIWEILSAQKEKGTSLILTTHYMEEAEYLCDRILFLHNGRIIAGGSKEELFRSSGVFDVIEFTVSQERPTVESDEMTGMINYTWNPVTQSGRIMVKDMKRALPDFFRIMEKNGVEIRGLECRSVNLDDLFLSLTGRRLRGEGLHTEGKEERVHLAKGTEAGN
jgi:ABC-2 type transport system ATP-binding protein